MKSSDLKSSGESPAHQERDVLVGEVGGGHELEIDGDRTSIYRACQGRLGASQLAKLGRGGRRRSSGASEMIAGAQGRLQQPSQSSPELGFPLQR
jgi:hypothetical protein